MISSARECYVVRRNISIQRNRLTYELCLGYFPLESVSFGYVVIWPGSLTGCDFLVGTSEASYEFVLDAVI